MKAELGQGRFQATREGYGFVLPDGGGPDVYVSPEETADALHRDRVEYEILQPARGTWRAEGAIRRVLERGFRTFTGIVEGTRKRPYLVPDHPLLPLRMRLVGDLREVEPGQRVLCAVHGGGRARASAMLTRILGDADDPRLDEAVVMSEYGLPESYPPDAVAEAEVRHKGLMESGLPGRVDFSGEEAITIDPSDARDFDDAVSLERDPRGFWLLRVHVADVAEAVLPGGALDREARRRGNSTYLPGRMIPMLPESLATDLMSLSPGVPKRVLTISARIGDTGRILGARADEAWIVSRQRLDYDFVQQVLEGGSSGDPRLDTRLREMDRVAQILRGRRFARGGFNLLVPEVQVTVDERGLPLEIRRRESLRSHQIIEEFMILANRAACARALKHRHPYLYRVHDEPDPLAVMEFADAVRTLAPEVRAKDLGDLPSIRRWLGSLPGEARTWRIHAVFLKSLRHAEYAHEDRGHFGLGLHGYAHFTSPIRRYPDLFNHRVIKWSIRHGNRPVPPEWRDEVEETAALCSAAEERSERAEREIIRLKCLRWAERRMGDSFRGRVAAVLPAGYFVELDDVPVEGFVPRIEAEPFAAQIEPRFGIGPGRGGLQVMDPVIVQIGRVEMRERRLQFLIRAAGRRALTTEPEKMEPLIDASEQMRAGHRRAAGRAKRRREKAERAAARREAKARLKPERRSLSSRKRTQRPGTTPASTRSAQRSGGRRAGRRGRGRMI